MNQKSDDVGVNVLLYLYDNPHSTTSKIAKEIWEVEDDTDYRNKDRKVRYYLEDKYDHLVDKEKADGKNYYTIKQGSVYLGYGKINVESFSGYEVSIGLGEVIIHYDKEDRPLVITLNSEDSEED